MSSLTVNSLLTINPCLKLHGDVGYLFKMKVTKKTLTVAVIITVY